MRQQNDNDYVSTVTLPRRWFNAFVWVFTAIVIGNVIAEFLGWDWSLLGGLFSTLERTAILITFTTGVFFAVANLTEGLKMLVPNYKKTFYDKGQTDLYEKMLEWEKRRKAAEARGDTFTEPMPTPSTSTGTQPEHTTPGRGQD